ncbi:hypothetical protein [Haloquadratum walsbyi]|uniref:hypothetical protein n=1 Tax=Haloquadratum walsbyi TaxID=293091 RepID=UPI0026ECD10A|nr:hypothetical protein [Haloquadratum walsbyi]
MSGSPEQIHAVSLMAVMVTSVFALCFAVTGDTEVVSLSGISPNSNTADASSNTRLTGSSSISALANDTIQTRNLNRGNASNVL